MPPLFFFFFLFFESFEFKMSLTLRLKEKAFVALSAPPHGMWWSDAHQRLLLKIQRFVES